MNILVDFIGVFFLLILIVLAIAILVNLGKRKEKPEAQKKTYLDVPLEQTTKLPIPLGALTCSHNWQIVNKERIDGENDTTTILVLKCDGCGALDKTIEKIVKRCKHDWVEQESINIKSAFEQMANQGMQQYANNPTAKNAWIYRKVSVRVSKCSKCGMLDRIEATNIPEVGEQMPQGEN